MSTENKTHLTDSMGVEGLVALAWDRVCEAQRKYKPVYMSGALSGGGDSIAACIVASVSPGFQSMFHINTGVGLQATEDYVAMVCKARGWELEVFHALENTRANGTPDAKDYFTLISRHGFPGPSQHFKMYSNLKERQIRRWRKAHKKYRSRQTVMLISGARRQESKKRKDVPLMERRDSIAWVNPLFDASKLDCTRIREHYGIPKSPVVDLIHMSGECLCGAFGSEEEMRELKLWFKDDPTVQRLAAFDSSERAAGRWGWGCGGPPNKRNCPVKKSGPMCSACDAKHETMNQAKEKKQ